MISKRFVLVTAPRLGVTSVCVSNRAAPSIALPSSSSLCGNALWSQKRCLLSRASDTCAARQQQAVHANPSDSQGSFTEVAALDIFAQSRLTNYVNRVVGEGASIRGKQEAPADVQFTQTAAHQSEGFLKTTLAVPVDVVEHGQLVRRAICAVGFGPDEKSARVACCMHAERCLDALGIPIFSSERRQKERAAQAKKEGRRAPSSIADASPQDLSEALLPPPVRVMAAPADHPAKSACAAASPTTESLYSTVKMTSYQPQVGTNGDARQESGDRARYFTQRRRSQQHRLRYGADPFLSQLSDELVQLQHVMMQRACAEDENDENGSLSSPMTIEAHEVSILQPTDSEADAHTSMLRMRGASARLISGAAHTLATAQKSKSIGYQHPERMHGVRGRESAALVDESEHGVFDLVEGNGEVWVWNPLAAGPWCIRDPYAVSRLNNYFQRTRQADFALCVSLHTSSEPTTFLDRDRRCFDVKEATWYTAAVALPEIAPAADSSSSFSYTALGKSPSAERAVDLCAMHAEALLGYVGIPIYVDDAKQQARYYAASLDWGRYFSPVPRLIGSEAPTALPKPLKEWLLTTKTRYRTCPLNISEKLMALNRRVVSHFRQHLLELDFTSDGYYDDVIALAEPCLRRFMIAKSHPFEAAFFNFVYQRNSQYRCSVYLPLPERYGVRGGCAIAATPQRARELCALHAVDTLCALNAVPEDCLQHPNWQRLLALREQKGFIVPNRAASSPQMRSPPAYREVAHFASHRLPLARDVWRVMMLDADTFDVTVPLYAESAVGGKEMAEKQVNWHQVLTQLFETCMRFHAGWGPDELWRKVHHYCGAQHVHGHRRMAANNYWLVLPLDEGRYGQHVAVGRCVTRLGALRQMHIHALRILHTLEATPWSALPQRELLFTVYKGNATEMNEQLSSWDLVKSRLLTNSVDLSTSVCKLAKQGAVREAEVLPARSASCARNGQAHSRTWETKSDVLCPHPVMSFDLASKTFA